MTAQGSTPDSPRRLARSIGALLAGFLTGNYVTAMLAPHVPMRHVWILGFIGLFFGAMGAIATAPMNLGPAWYPIAIALTALPCSWVGGALYQRTAVRRIGEHA